MILYQLNIVLETMGYYLKKRMGGSPGEEPVT